MLKKTLVIALIGVMVGGVAMGVISLANRSSTSATSGGRGQEQADGARASLPQGQGRGQRSEVSKAGAVAYGGRNFETEHEDCDCEDCTSGDEYIGQNQRPGSRGVIGRSSEQDMQQPATEQAAGARGAGQGLGRYATEQETSAPGAGQGLGRYATEQETSALGAGQGVGGGGGGGNSCHTEPVDQITVDCTVVVMGEHTLIELEDGTELELGVGPEFYGEEIGFSTEVGDKLTVTGFHEDGEFKVLSIVDESGTLMTFRDENGRPGWAGRGSRKNSII
jgi:hypothetical protein